MQINSPCCVRVTFLNSCFFFNFNFTKFLKYCKCRIGSTELIQGQGLFAFLSQMQRLPGIRQRHLFGGSAYLSKCGIQSCNIHITYRSVLDVLFKISNVHLYLEESLRAFPFHMRVIPIIHDAMAILISEKFKILWLSVGM